MSAGCINTTLGSSQNGSRLVITLSRSMTQQHLGQPCLYFLFADMPANLTGLRMGFLRFRLYPLEQNFCQFQAPNWAGLAASWRSRAFVAQKCIVTSECRVGCRFLTFSPTSFLTGAFRLYSILNLKTALYLSARYSWWKSLSFSPVWSLWLPVQN